MAKTVKTQNPSDRGVVRVSIYQNNILGLKDVPLRKRLSSLYLNWRFALQDWLAQWPTIETIYDIFCVEKMWLEACKLEYPHFFTHSTFLHIPNNNFSIFSTNVPKLIENTFYWCKNDCFSHILQKILDFILWYINCDHKTLAVFSTLWECRCATLRLLWIVTKSKGTV